MTEQAAVQAWPSPCPLRLTGAGELSRPPGRTAWSLSTVCAEAVGFLSRKMAHRAGHVQKPTSRSLDGGKSPPFPEKGLLRADGV